MAEGGFLVKFDGKDIVRCYAVAFNYDMHQFIVNERDEQELPLEVNTITIEIERHKIW